jgi:hypothetical protein
MKDFGRGLERSDIVGRSISNVLVADEGRHGEFDLISVFVQIEGRTWFSLGTYNLEEQLPLKRVHDVEVAPAKNLNWDDSKTCFGRTVREVVIDSWPTIGLLLDNDLILCTEFFSTAMRPKVVPLTAYKGRNELKTHWGHHPIVGSGEALAKDDLL